MKYSMSIIAAGREIVIPVLPSKLEVSSPGKNEKTTVLGLGEVLRLKGRPLRSVEWESFFPARTAPYATGKLLAPIEAVKAIQAARDAKTPVRFLLVGSDLDINTSMGVDAFDYEERAGEMGDIYYQIKLTEWRDYSPKRLVLTLTESSAPVVQEQEPERAGEPDPVRTHTVVRGDSLWAIAKKNYGDGARYPAIYSANKEVIDKRNKGTGNSKYTIYPGQVFTIP